MCFKRFPTNLKCIRLDRSARKCSTRIVAVDIRGRVSAVSKDLEAAPIHGGGADIQLIALRVSNGIARCVSVLYI